MIRDAKIQLWLKKNSPESPPDIKAHRIEPKECGEKREMHKMGEEYAENSINTVARQLCYG